MNSPTLYGCAECILINARPHQLWRGSLVLRLSCAPMKNRKQRGEPGKICHVRNVIGRENLRLRDTKVGVVSGPDGPAAYVRLQLQNTKDESRGTTQTSTARSNERSLRVGRARVVKVREFSSQIPLPQTTGREERQRRGTILNIF